MGKSKLKKGIHPGYAPDGLLSGASRGKTLWPFVSEQDDKLRAVTQLGVKFQRCKGGRIVLSGYVCAHCMSEDPIKDCGSLHQETQAATAEPSKHSGKFHLDSPNQPIKTRNR